MVDLNPVRADFPILRTQANNKPLIYLDNAATTQKPSCVIATLREYYEKTNANIHRGVHYLSGKATEQFEAARHTVQHFINAPHAREIIFTRGTTESINLVAHSFGERYVRAGDEILISYLEHHSNIVPWQLLAKRTGAVLKVIPMLESGDLDLDAFYQLLNKKTKIVAVTHLSNALGTLNPVQEIIRAAHALDIPVLLDGAQAIAHEKIDVTELDCDFYVFSSHKIYGPTGVGVLYGKEKWLTEMPPFLGGGDMILTVRFEGSTYNELPYKFEAGTPAIAAVIGLGAALNYLSELDLSALFEHEMLLLQEATQRLKAIAGVRIIGEAKEKRALVSFTVQGIHPHDLGTILDQVGIAIRTGHHCAMPVMEFYGVPATARASFGIYNTLDEVEHFVAAVEKAKNIL